MNGGDANGPVPFTLSGARTGAKRCVSLRSAALSWDSSSASWPGKRAELGRKAVLMSALVFSGPTQFVVLGMWSAPLPVATIIALTSLIINLRYLLIWV